MVEQRKSITMKDVALEAGVSVGTVSRVINKEKGIKEVTLKKVEQAIKTLNYIPDYYARGIEKKSNRNDCNHCTKYLASLLFRICYACGK